MSAGRNAGPPAPAERRSQVLKGALDLCVMAVLNERPMYGYGLVAALTERGLGLVAEGSVYPLLTRLEKRGLLRSYRAPSPGGPARKYYELTDDGRKALTEGAAAWRSVALDVAAVLDGV
ncbi:MAG: PadR family transcriptional regulator [Actinomycetota bacterium]|nr:PadR family transcriptional regulator [Actinomycetota bacterium]